MLDDVHLVDTSAWSKARNRVRPGLDDWLDQQLRAGLLATCEIIAMELLQSAQNEQRFDRQTQLLTTLIWCPIQAREWSRAREVQALLAKRGTHRGIGPADLLIAAAAERAEMPLLHYDHDYDLIAEVTNQPTRWLLPRGQLP